MTPPYRPRWRDTQQRPVPVAMRCFVLVCFLLFAAVVPRTSGGGPKDPPNFGNPKETQPLANPKARVDPDTAKQKATPSPFHTDPKEKQPGVVPPHCHSGTAFLGGSCRVTFYYDARNVLRPVPSGTCVD